MAAWFKGWREHWGRWSGWPAGVGGLMVGMIITGLRLAGGLQGLELALYDQMLRWRPAEPTDKRVVVVEITEADIQRLGQWPLQDQVLTKAIRLLLSANPRVIGVDLYRDIPQEPGTADLYALLAKEPKVITVCKLGDVRSPGIKPPPAIAAAAVPERVGFADMVVDAGGTVRRALLGVQPDPTAACPTANSLAVQTALRFLALEGIRPQQTPDGRIVLGRGVFPRLTSHSGPYQGIDDRGYQVLLNYRGPRRAVEQVTLGELLAQQVPPALIQDRLVLIGTTAASAKDDFYTPYSAGLTDDQKMAGVVIHGQIASQLISAALDGRTQIWYWPEAGEILWIFLWAGVGGLLAWRLRHPAHFLLGLTGGALAVVGIGMLLFRWGGWIPVVPPALAIVATGIVVVAYTAYETDRQHRLVAAKVAQQQEQITRLQNLLESTQATEVVTPGVPATASPHRETGLLAGRYQVVRVLGEGGFGRTYLAKDTQRPRQPDCVVKQLKPGRTDSQFLEIARRLFNTEAEILEVLGRHRQIPQLLAYFEEEREFYLVQEYIEGTSLDKELVPGQKRDETYTLALLRGILEVLAFVHEHKVIHRDIKPANIIRRAKDQRLVLIDFGAVKQIRPMTGEKEAEYTVAVGTRGYAPSEQMAGRPQLNSDIYAVGMIAIQALTGIPPRDLELHPDTGLPIWRPHAQVSTRLADILDKMVAYFYTDRYPTALDVLRDLRGLP
ncbi:MAG: CHASE2 domain-containing serine/threonine-protein kinase [Gloeomargarita sp. SKYB31]|nr:CHASE2 domain-containing serine/threonine-protein kinase [Gloeomargarita sp. SKYB31]